MEKKQGEIATLERPKQEAKEYLKQEVSSVVKESGGQRVWSGFVKFLSYGGILLIIVLGAVIYIAIVMLIK